MQDAARLAHPNPSRFALTGGEPFLDFELLLELATHARDLGGQATCVTNGYWATSDKRALEILRQLKTAGLEILAVSTSRFHQQFVKRQRVERVLRAARQLDMDCTLKYIRTSSDPAPMGEIERWAFAAGATAVQDIALLPSLRPGVSLPETEYLRVPGIPKGVCPGAVLTVREDGQAFGCCTPGADTGFFSLGDTSDTALRAIRDRFCFDGKQQLLRSQGPEYFANAIASQGLAHRLRDSYTSVCDLCVHIASDPVMASVAGELAHRFEVSQLEQILGPLVSAPVHNQGASQ